MKIDKIDREAEKRQKERHLEIKNKDIESIIKKAKQEIKEEERRQKKENAGQQTRMDISHDEGENLVEVSPAILPTQVSQPGEKPQLVHDTTRNPISAVASMSSTG